MSSNWKQRHQAQHQSRQMMYSDQESWNERSPEEMDRLQELREKQQPWVDWTVNWARFILKNEYSKDDPFESNKTVSIESFALDGKTDSVTFREVHTEYTFPTWTSYRVKATLRAGKMLPYSIWAKLKPQSQWKSVEKAILEAGDLPDLAPEVLNAVSTVRNQGYREALEQVQAGVVPDNGSAGQKAQNRALDLVAAILRDWSSQDDRAKQGAQRSVIDKIDLPIKYM